MSISSTNILENACMIVFCLFVYFHFYLLSYQHFVVQINTLQKYNKNQSELFFLVDNCILNTIKYWNTEGVLITRLIIIRNNKKISPDLFTSRKEERKISGISGGLPSTHTAILALTEGYLCIQRSLCQFISDGCKIEMIWDGTLKWSGKNLRWN